MHHQNPDDAVRDRKRSKKRSKKVTSMHIAHTHIKLQKATRTHSTEINNTHSPMRNSFVVWFIFDGLTNTAY